MKERKEIKNAREEFKRNLEARAEKTAQSKPTEKWVVDTSSGLVANQIKWRWNCQ